MVRPRIRWIAVTIAGVVAALAFLWAISVVWQHLSPLWDSRTVIAIEIIIAIVALALLAGIWWLWWWLPQRQVARLAIQISDPKDRADTEDNFRKTVGQALGGAAVLIGAVAAYLQFTQQQQSAKDLLISSQLAKGFEQLADGNAADGDKVAAGDKIIMRLGGIYGLEGVMNASEQYHPLVLEVLCAFVRTGTIGKPVNDVPAPDIQAALTVIGRQGSGGVDLAAANIRGALLGRARLIRAILTRAHLEAAHLEAARLDGAQLDFAYLISAYLSGAYLKDAYLNYAHLSGADLRGADLSGAHLLFADLHGITDLRGADLSGAHLNSADLRGADLNKAILTRADLSGTLLDSARGLSPIQLALACGQPASSWPEGFPTAFTLQPCPASDLP